MPLVRNVAVWITLLLTPAALANDAKISLPDDTLGNIAARFLDVVESGGEDQIAAFVEEFLSPAARKAHPGAAALLLKLHQQSGGLDPVEVRPATGEQPLVVIARSRRGDRLVRLQMGLDAATRDQLAGFAVSRWFDSTASTLTGRAPGETDREAVAAIRDEVERRAKAAEFSGVVLVAKKDRVLLHEAWGVADAEQNVPVTVDSAFHLASVGKMFTAVAIGQLVRQGKLAWDDPVGKILPDFPDRKIADAVRVRHLLTHTAGMGTFFWSPGYDSEHVYRNATEEIEVYREETLAFEPGARWRYSNAGYSLLGAIIEKVSGMSYLDYIRRNVLRPLRMGATDTNEPGEVAGNAAILYTQSENDPLGLEDFQSNRKIRASHATGFGDGSATAMDLFRFARAYRRDRLPGGVRVADLTREKVPDGGPGGMLFGYGVVERTINGQLVRGHSGGGRSDVQMIWDGEWTVVVQTNRTPPSATMLMNEILRFLTS